MWEGGSGWGRNRAGCRLLGRLRTSVQSPLYSAWGGGGMAGYVPKEVIAGELRKLRLAVWLQLGAGGWPMTAGSGGASLEIPFPLLDTCCTFYVHFDSHTHTHFDIACHKTSMGKQ